MNDGFHLKVYFCLQISEFLKNSTTNVRVYDVPGNSTVDPALLDNFTSLQYAVVVCVFVEILGGILFLISAAYLVKDKAKATRVMLGECAEPCILIKCLKQNSCS